MGTLKFTKKKNMAVSKAQAATNVQHFTPKLLFCVHKNTKEKGGVQDTKAVAQYIMHTSC